MKTVTIFQGVPGVGKTSLAKTLVNADTVRVNKDAIREMLHFGGIKIGSEALVLEIEMLTARAALKHGKNVIVDDCNLGLVTMWANLAVEMGATPVLRYFGRNVDKAIKQYCEREKKNFFKRVFGPLVIRGMGIFS